MISSAVPVSPAVPADMPAVAGAVVFASTSTADLQKASIFRLVVGKS